MWERWPCRRRPFENAQVFKTNGPRKRRMLLVFFFFNGTWMCIVICWLTRVSSRMSTSFHLKKMLLCGQTCIGQAKLLSRVNRKFSRYGAHWPAQWEPIQRPLGQWYCTYFGPKEQAGMKTAQSHECGSRTCSWICPMTAGSFMSVLDWNFIFSLSWWTRGGFSQTK